MAHDQQVKQACSLRLIVTQIGTGSHDRDSFSFCCIAGVGMELQLQPCCTALAGAWSTDKAGEYHTQDSPQQHVAQRLMRASWPCPGSPSQTGGCDWQPAQHCCVPLLEDGKLVDCPSKRNALTLNLSGHCVYLSDTALSIVVVAVCFGCTLI